MDSYAVHFYFFLSFSCLFLVYFLVARYACVVTTRLSCLERKVLSSCSSLLLAHWSFRCPCHVNWLLCVTIKERKSKYKTNQFLNIQEREGDIFHDQSSFVLWTVFFFFSFFLFFHPGTTGIGDENCASLHVSKNRDNIQVSWTWTHSVKFPAIKKGDQRLCNLKKKKNRQLSSFYSCFFTHNGITTPKTTREGQESTTETSLHLAWPPNFKNQVLLTPRAQNRVLDLGLLFCGCRPKPRSSPGRVEVIQPVAHAFTTFWLTSTRTSLTRLHRNYTGGFRSWPPTSCRFSTWRSFDHHGKGEGNFV